MVMAVEVVKDNRRIEMVGKDKRASRLGSRDDESQLGNGRLWLRAPA